MAEGLFMLLVLSAIMAVASFLAGVLPLSFSLSRSQLRLISTVGMGVLVGTSLIVIIPEGIETLYSASDALNANVLQQRNLPLDRRWSTSFPIGSNHLGEAPTDLAIRCTSSINCPQVHENRETKEEEKKKKSKPEKKPETPEMPGKKDHSHKTSKAEGDTEHSHHEHPAKARSPHVWVGIALILGFVLMYLINEIPRHAGSRVQSRPVPYHISLDNLSQGLHRSPLVGGEEEEQRGFLRSRLSPTSSQSTATTTGLVIHAAADGIALGASSSASDTGLGFVIFLAIMVHKAPAAFGLTSVLLKQGLSKRAARAHLIVFSLAAPFGALSTWMLGNLLSGGATGDVATTRWWTGILLLFSAGTFLYVAMHAMQENTPGHKKEQVNGYSMEGNGVEHSVQEVEESSLRDVVAAVVGMLLPLLTQFGHHH